MKFAFLFLMLFAVLTAQAQTVVRGPYLQSPTQDGIIVMWRSNAATNSVYGTGQIPPS